MQTSVPSRTALRVALRRAAHQMYDWPPVFEDRFAVRILGEAYAEELRRTPVRRDRPFSVGLRAFLVARSRYAEEQLERAVAAGVRQYVLLGAGLDTFGIRNLDSELRVFEVDHPATQAWKRELLQKAGIGEPENLVFVPVDFEREVLANRLAAAGFARGEGAFFAWLGVVPYLTLEAFRLTTAFIAASAAGSGVTLDYSQPRSALPYFERLAHDSLSARVRMAGEPFQLHFTPEEIARELAGFSAIEDLGSEEINARYFAGRSDGLKTMGKAGRMLTAWV